MEIPYSNPFTPSFGSIPPLMAGRQSLIDDVLSGLHNGPGDPNRTTIFIGARGTGKTALMAKIAEEAEGQGWIKAQVTAVGGMLEDIIERTTESARQFIDQQGGSQITGIGAFGFSVSRQVLEQPQGNWRTRMNRLLDSLAEQNIGLLITVYEVSLNTEEFKTFAAAFQHFITERRNVALLMAGLPFNISTVLQDKSISFLRRALQRHIGLVSVHDATETIRRTFELTERSITQQDAGIAGKASEGFPYLMQLIGYHIWRQHPETEAILATDVIAGIEYARAEMNTSIFDATLRELSLLDMRFLKAMSADDGASELATIAKRLDVSTNQANQYRRRLIEQGIIAPQGRGRLGFEIPMLKDYIRKHYVD